MFSPPSLAELPSSTMNECLSALLESVGWSSPVNVPECSNNWFRIHAISHFRVCSVGKCTYVAFPFLPDRECSSYFVHTIYTYFGEVHSSCHLSTISCIKTISVATTSCSRLSFAAILVLRPTSSTEMRVRLNGNRVEVRVDPSSKQQRNSLIVVSTNRISGLYSFSIYGLALLRLPFYLLAGLIKTPIPICQAIT